MVRTMYQRPQLNRFVIGGKTYQRNSIVVSFVVHRSLRGTSEETTIKLHFRGDETLRRLRTKSPLPLTTAGGQPERHRQTREDRHVRTILHYLVHCEIPQPSDRHNLMPRAVVEASPFHSSFFITNLKSLGIDTIFHHIYNFGTTSQFLSLGKEKYKAVVVGKERVEIKNSAARHCDRREHLRRSSLRAFDQAYEKVHPSPGHAGRAPRAA